MKRKILAFALVFVIITLTLPPLASQPYWTVMVYMDGDNNLETAAIDDFNELEFAGSTADVNIVVQFDRISGYDTSNGNWDTTRRYYVTQDPNGYDGTIASTLISDLGELNMGDPTTLTNFVNWARTNYPADYYLLVLWDHGDGWKTRSARVVQKGPLTSIVKREPVKGVCYDDTDDDYLTTPDIQTALNTATTGGAFPVDVVGFDACLMAMLEIGYEISPYSSYIVASEESCPNDGWDYETSMDWLVNNPTSTPDQVASQIVIDFMNFAWSPFEAIFVTQSAVDLSQIGAVAAAVDTLASDLIANIDTCFYYVRDARNQVLEYMDYDFIDLYHFAQLLNAESCNPLIRTDAQNVMNAVTAAVIQEGHGSLNANSHGISIYFPYGGSDYLSRYATDTTFAADTLWDEFLTTYYSTVTPPMHSVVLVDDDSGRLYTHVETYYMYALDSLGIPYDYYDASIHGTPDLTYLRAFDVVIWFTGSDFSTTLSVEDETVLIQYLAWGGKLFFSSQDYIWDLHNDGRYPSTFLRSYLHTTNDGEDTGVVTLSGVAGNDVGDGLGPYTMCWITGGCTFLDYADWITKDGVSEYAFYNESAQYMAVTYSGGYETVFFSFRFEGIGAAAEREEVMQRIFDFFGPISTFGFIGDLFSTNTFLVAGDSAYCTDVLGSAKIAFALGMAGAESPEGRTDAILTAIEHDTGNLISIGGPAINPVTDEFDGYFSITYDHQIGVSFEIFADSECIFLDLANYPNEDIAIIYLAEHNNRYVLLVWGYGWQGTYAASVYLGDIANWDVFQGAHLLMLRWVDTDLDGLVDSNEITVEDSR